MPKAAGRYSRWGSRRSCRLSLAPSRPQQSTRGRSARGGRDPPHWNIGLAPGKSGLVVIDIDSPVAEHYIRELGGFDSPTRTCVTPRGSHLYFRLPASAISERPFFPMLDVRCFIGYVPLPPSVHPSGQGYRWLGESRSVAELPPPLARRLEHYVPSEGMVTVIDGGVERVMTRLTYEYEQCRARMERRGQSGDVDRLPVEGGARWW